MRLFGKKAPGALAQPSAPASEVAMSPIATPVTPSFPPEITSVRSSVEGTGTSTPTTNGRPRASRVASVGLGQMQFLEDDARYGAVSSITKSHASILTVVRWCIIYMARWLFKGG